MIGETLGGHYRIESKLGEGGMGVVYKARDAHLDRAVAAKLLLPDTIADPRRRERFVREARAASALNHPNIVTIHEIRSDGGIDFIVMEYVEGQTLEQLIPAAGLRPAQALAYAVQMADAFAKAHSAGVLHRDIKPSNVMITGDGRVKILDFGLAKLTERTELSPDAPTLPARLTEEGVLLGTVEYMSPEQAEGQEVDARSDIFSFGIVLYQMLTGRRPFTASSRLKVLGRIAHDEPEPPSSFAAISPELEKVILRCLRKDPARRFQTMADLKVALEDLRVELASGASAAHARSPSRVPLAVVATAVMIAGIAAWFAWRAMKARPPQPLEAAALTTFSGIENFPSLSPDGNHVAFTWDGPRHDNEDIYVQLIGSGSPLRITTDPKSETNAAWSPDGRWIAFLRGTPELVTSVDLDLLLIPPLGGPERKLTTVRVRQLHDFEQVFLTWCPDSRCLVVTDSQGEGRPDALFVVSTESGEKRQLTRPQPPSMGDLSPAISPDGRSLAYHRTSAWSVGELLLQPLDENLTPRGEPRRLTDTKLNASYPAWLPDSKTLLFSAKNGMWRMRVDEDEPPERIPFVGEDAFMIAVARRPLESGARLVYARTSIDANIWRIDVPRAGAPPASPPEQAIASTRVELHPRPSPDGRRVAFASDRSGEWEIWLADPDGSNAIQLTSMHARTTGGPWWSIDGQWIAFGSNLVGEFELYKIPSAGGSPRRLTANPAFDQCASFSRDGRSLYFCSNRTGIFEMWKSDLDGRNPRQITTGGGWFGVESYDGKSLYYLKGPDATSTSLWRKPLPDGEPVEIVSNIVWWSFWVNEQGIYYIDREGDARRLRFLDFATGTHATVAASLGEVECCVSSSADGRTIFYTRRDSEMHDLMLVDGVR